MKFAELQYSSRTGTTMVLWSPLNNTTLFCRSPFSSSERTSPAPRLARLKRQQSADGIHGVRRRARILHQVSHCEPLLCRRQISPLLRCDHLSRPLLRLAFAKMGFTRIVEITAARNTMPPGWGDMHLCLLGIRENSIPFEPPVVAPDEINIERRDQRLGGYVRQLLSPVHNKIGRQTERVKALESAIKERNIRLDSMERTVDERTKRITSLEASLEERDQDSVHFRMRWMLYGDGVLDIGWVRLLGPLWEDIE